MSETPIVFLAAFPPIQSAIKVGQDGARIQLDIPETELEAVQALLAMRGKVLIVTVQERVEESLGNGGSEAKRRAAISPTEMARRRV